MILKKVKLKNFRQYYGEQELEFSIDPEKNITLIYGKNGAGKTSLFTALNWVLYGFEEVKIDGKIVNKKAIEEAKSKEKYFVQSEVVLTFSHLGRNYQIKREIIFDVVNNESQINEEMEVLSPDPKKISTPLIALNPILPPNVRTYFFFDGEKIDEFSKPKHDKEVKEAVYKVLGVNTIERAISHIKDIARDYNKRLKSMSTGKLKDLREEYDSLMEKIEKLDEEIENLKEERKSLEIQREEIIGRLREIGEINEEFEEKEKLEKRLENLEKELDNAYKNICEAINKSFLLIGSSAIEESEDLIKNILQDTEEIPVNYIIKLIEDILKEKKCICGSELNIELKENLMNKKIELSNQQKEDKTEYMLLEINNKIPELKSKRDENLNNLELYFQRKNEIKREIIEIQQKLDEISQKLKNHEIEDIKKLSNKLSELSQEIGEINQKIENLKSEREKLKEEREKIRSLISQEEKKEKKFLELKKREALTEEIYKQLEKVYEKLPSKLQKEIENEATNIFRKLIRKKEYFQRIKLSEDFILKLVDVYGDEEAKTEISAGERQVLSLSFILALAKVSKKEAPFVMDTPFGRLDPEHRKNILREIPNLARQIVLFVTPSEMTDDMKKIIENKIGKEYELDFDEVENYTKISYIGE